MDALVRKLSSTDLLPVPSARRYAVWNTLRSDIISASEAISESGAALRYLAWKDVDKVFARRHALAYDLCSRANVAVSAGSPEEAAMCCDWALALMDALPEDKSLRSSLTSLRESLGNVAQAALPGLSYIGREVSQIRKALGKSLVPSKPVAAPAQAAIPAQEETYVRVLLHGLAGIPGPPAESKVAAAGLSAHAPNTVFQLLPETTTPSYGRLSFMVLAQASASPSFEPGLMIGIKPGRFGGYVSARSSLGKVAKEYSCLSDGTTDFGYFWASGKEMFSRLDVSAGILAGLAEWLDLYAGAGYGDLGRYWQDTAGQWAKVLDKSFSGAMLEAGIIVSFRRLSFQTGVSTISFKACAPALGLGICF